MEAENQIAPEAEAVAEATPKKQKKVKPEKAESERAIAKKFDEKTIAMIRRKRAEKNEAGSAKHSHAALAKEFNTTAGTISQIVRNRSYKDPNYKPVNDGA